MKPLLLTLFAGSILLAAATPREFVLFENGKSDYAIVLPDAPTAEEEGAARELQEYFRKLTGVLLAVHPASQKSAPAFVIGWTPQTENALGTTSESMMRDQIRIKTRENGDIFITGATAFGIRYALAQFLEDFLGIRWWGWGEEYLPLCQRLAIPPIDLDYAPAFIERTPTASFLYEKSDILAHRMRCNSLMNADTSPRAIHTFMERSHTLEKLLPDENYLKAHPDLYDPENPPTAKPEFYALRDGRRLGATSQPCMTNPEALQQVVTNAKYLLHKQMPNADIIWITQNDNTEICLCHRCMEAEKRLGNRADLNIDFMNRVADALQEEFPGIAVETFAYQFTLEPPKTIRPNEHVHVRVCLIEASNAHPLTHPINRRYREALEGWTAISDNVNVWFYTVNFTNFGLAHPNTATIPQDIRLFQELKVKKILPQDSSDEGAFGWFTPYRQNLIAHCIWNPRLDDEAFKRDFFQKYYGPAAKPLLQLLDRYQEIATASKWPMPCYMLDTGRWLSPEELDLGDCLVQEAMDLAKESGQDKYVKRVQALETVLEWTRFWRMENSYLRTVTRHPPMIPLENTEGLVQALAERVRRIPRTPAWKNQYTGPSLRLDAHLEHLRRRLTPEAPPQALPPLLADTRPGHLVVIPREAFQIDRSTYVDDAKAPVRNSSVRLSTRGFNWLMRVDLPAMEDAGEWEVFAELRLPDAVQNPSGVAALTGFYSYGTNFAEVTRVSIPAETLSRDEYRLLPLGTIDFHRDFQVYFAGNGNDATPELLLGRIFLRRAK